MKHKVFDDCVVQCFCLQLAKHFYENNEIDIIFYASGKHLLEIQKNGIKVTKSDNVFLQFQN